MQHTTIYEKYNKTVMQHSTIYEKYNKTVRQHTTTYEKYNKTLCNIQQYMKNIIRRGYATYNNIKKI